MNAAFRILVSVGEHTGEATASLLCVGSADKYHRKMLSLIMRRCSPLTFWYSHCIHRSGNLVPPTRLALTTREANPFE
jgi:hypothetical protein